MTRSDNLTKLFLCCAIILSLSTILISDVFAGSAGILSEKELRSFLLKLGNYYPDRERIIKSPLHNGKYLSSFKKFDSNEIISAWKADINNNGIMDYALITYAQGSGHYDHMEIYLSDEKGNLRRPEFSLSKKGKPSNVASPPIIYEDGKTYVVLEHIWAENINREPVYAGANSNAARDAYYLLREKYKYFIKNNTVTLVDKKLKEFNLYDKDKRGR